MCVIAFSPKGTDIPDETKLKKMWDKNPDGAGIMMELPGNVNSYVKGLMTWEDFKDELAELNEAYKLKDLNVAFHFRIGTAGRNDGPTTHPFRLNSSYKKLRQLNYFGTEPLVMHNGVIPKFGGKLDKNSSDTQDFVALIMSNLWGKIDNETLKQTITSLVNTSKLLIFNEGKVALIGSWEEKEGIKYSNTLWDSTVYYEGVYTSSTYTGRTTLSSPTISTYNKSTPNIYGMYKDEIPAPYGDVNWIEYTTQDKMDTILKGRYIKHKIEGTESYVYKPSWMTNKQQEELNKRQVFYVDKENPLMIYNEDGLENYLEMKADLMALDDDIIEFTDQDQMLEELDMMDFNPDKGTYKELETGKEYYVDMINMTMYTETGLSRTYGKNWRNARKELELTQSMNTDWNNPTEEDFNELKELCIQEKGWQTQPA